MGAGDEVLAHAGYLQPRHAVEDSVEVVGDGPLVMADRWDVDQGGGQGQEVGHRPATPCWRSTSSSWALSWRPPSLRRRMTRAQGSPNSPPGNERGRVAVTATHHGGTTPRLSCSPVSASMTGMDLDRMSPAPSTAPRPTRAPSTTMQRLPIRQSSSTTTGAAWGGSSTPPMPTPPERWTLAPIWAQDPTVAQVSTMVLAPTRAPMFT